MELLEKSFEIVEGKEMIGTFTINPAKTRLDCIMSCINTIGCHAVNVKSNNRNNYITCQLFTESCKPRHMSNNINSTTYFRSLLSGGSRISPRRGAPTLQGGPPTYDFAKFSQKLHEIERIWTPRGARVQNFTM